MLKASCIATIFLFSLLFFITSSYASAPWLAGYVVFGSRMNVTEAPYSKYSELIQESMQVSGDSVKFNYLRSKDMSAFVDSCHAHNVKASFSIWDLEGENTAFNTATTKGNIAHFVQYIENIVATFHYDGVDIDWERPLIATQYIDLFHRLRAAMPTKMISVCISSYMTNDIADSINTDVNYFHAMMYDFDWYGKTENKTWHNAAIRGYTYTRYSYTSGEGYLYIMDTLKTKNIPHSKILYGVPFYGHLWKGATEPYRTGATSAGVIFYKDLVNSPSRWKPEYQKWDATYYAEYIAKTDSNMFITYNGERSMIEAVKFMNEQGLGGMFSCAADFEFLRNKTGDARYPLTTVLKAQLTPGGFTITSSADSTGTITPSGAVSVNSGGNQTFTITPAAGLRVSDVLVDSVSVGAVLTYTFTNVTHNHTIQARFAPVIRVNAIDNKTRVSSSGAVSGTAKVSINGVPSGTASFQAAFTSVSGTYQVATAGITALYSKTGAYLNNQTAITYYRVQCENEILRTPDTTGYTTAGYSNPLIPLGDPLSANNPNMPISVTDKVNGAMWLDIKIPSETPVGIYDGWFIVNPTGLNEIAIPITLTINPQETVSAPAAIAGLDSTIVGKSESYIARGASISFGHGVSCRFDWGDGNISAWGDTTRSHIWTTSGTFTIKSQARSPADTTKISAWSGNLKSVTTSYLTLNVTVNPGGSGSVTKNPDNAGYSYNESVQLTVNAAAGHVFGNWSGDVTGTTNPLTVPMTGNKNIISNFAATAGLQLSAFHGMARIPQSGAVSGGSFTVNIKAAKNEVESFQVAITSGSPQQITEASMSDLSDSFGREIKNTNATLYRVDYVNITQLSPNPESGYTTGYYADPLIPFINPVTGAAINKSGGSKKYALPIDVSSTLNGAIWVDIKVPSGTAAGVYNGSLTVTGSDLTKVSIPVSLTVWNFSLPDGPTCGSNFGYYTNISNFYGKSAGTSEFNAIEQRYAEETARHRINPPVPPRFLPEGDSNANLVMTDAKQDSLNNFIARNHITGIQISFESVPPGPLLANYFANYTNYMQSHGWLYGAYYWPIDEPNTSSDYEYITRHTSHAYSARPVVHTLVTEQTYPQDTTWPDISESVDIWCPLFEWIDEGTINRKLVKGERVWSYTTSASSTPPYHPQYSALMGKESAHWQIDRPLTNYRVPLWFNYRYHISGLLYYSMMSSGIPDPWTNPSNTLYGGYNGDGMLYYPGTPCGFEGPAPSIRLKNIRDGMEDYEYMKLLENLSSHDVVMSCVNTVSSEWWIFSKNPADFDQARENMANMITGNPTPSPKIIAHMKSQPSEYKVDNPYPNPFNNSTVIRYRIPKNCSVKLILYDGLGRKVTELQNGWVFAGEHEAVWNGRDMKGNLVASGIYIYSFHAEDYLSSGIVTLMK
jgi:GH18 family chitinase